MFHENKQLAIEKATGDWILYLDADERVTPELAKEVRSVIGDTCLPAGRPRYDGYWIPRKNIIFGKWIKNSFWYPDYQLRLFKKGKAFLPCKSHHEQPKLKGKAGYLKEALVHYNYRTVSQYIYKLNTLYTENDKNIILQSGKKIYWYDAIRMPANEFLATFFARQAYKDGLHGLILSGFQAFSALVTFAKIWETQGFKEAEDKDILVKSESEFKKVIKDLKYWFLTSKSKQARNPLKKISWRVIRRLLR
jgi:glycosyltransferase involved in cell wall biosynthesis